MYSTIGVFRGLIYGAVARGANLRVLCEKAGLEPADLHDTERKIEGIEAVHRLWEEIVASTGDPFIGLHMGEGYNPSTLGLVGYLMQNCPTLREVVAVMQRHRERVSGWVSSGFEETDEEGVSRILVKINPVWTQVSPATARQGTETTLAHCCHILRLLSGRQIVPRRVEISYPRPGPLAEYERVFGCPVLFGQKQNRIVFRQEDLALPVLRYDQSLYALFNRLLTEKGQEEKAQENFTERVRKVLMQDFKGLVPPLEVVAAHLNLSARSFQRKLQLEGSSYRCVATDLKKELALNLLQHANAKVQGIAEVLGYAEPSSFRKAFKGWTQATPVQVKKHQKPEPTGTALE